jgi:hypothetical protein
MKLPLGLLSRHAMAAGWILICSIAAYASEPIHLMEMIDFSGTNTVWEVTAERLRSWPRWDSTKEPPLRVSAAIEKAFLTLPVGEKRSDWQFNCISIQQPMDEEARKTYGPIFFYFVSLSRSSDSWSTWECLLDFRGDTIPFRKEKLPRDHESTTIIVTPKERRGAAK